MNLSLNEVEVQRGLPQDGLIDDAIHAGELGERDSSGHGTRGAHEARCQEAQREERSKEITAKRYFKEENE